MNKHEALNILSGAGVRKFLLEPNAFTLPIFIAHPEDEQSSKVTHYELVDRLRQKRNIGLSEILLGGFVKVIDRKFVQWAVEPPQGVRQLPIGVFEQHFSQREINFITSDGVVIQK